MRSIFDLHKISQEILENHAFDKYQPLTNIAGQVTAVLCTWCLCAAPLGVPIDHEDDCGLPQKGE
jgi:hypothetical protein